MASKALVKKRCIRKHVKSQNASSGSHQRVKVSAIFEGIRRGDRVQGISDEFVYAAFVQQHLALVKRDAESVPAERGGFQKCDDDRV